MNKKKQTADMEAWYQQNKKDEAEKKRLADERMRQHAARLAEEKERKQKAIAEHPERFTKHPTMCIIRPEDAESTLDRAIVFLRAGEDMDDALMAAGESGIAGACFESIVELPDDFDIGDHGLYECHSYIG